MFSAGLSIEEPIGVLLVVTKARSSCSKPPLETTEEDREEEGAASLQMRAPAEEITVDAAVATVLSGFWRIWRFHLRAQRMTLKAFICGSNVFCFTPCFGKSKDWTRR